MKRKKNKKIQFVAYWVLKKSSLGQKGTSVHKRKKKGGEFSGP